MKTVYFLLTVIGFGAVTLGMSFASEPPGQAPGEKQTGDRPAKEHADTTHPSQITNSNALEKGGHASPVKKAATTYRPIQAGPKSIANNHGNTGGKRTDNSLNKTPSVNNIHQPVSNQFSAAATDGLKMTGTGTPRPPEPAGKLPPVAGSVVRLPGVAGTHGAATAAIGQPTRTSVKNSAAAISGTGGERKPY